VRRQLRPAEGGEQCDDGNQRQHRRVHSTLQDRRCGDGFTQQGVEQCDDGNQVNTDACTNTCKTPCAATASAGRRAVRRRQPGQHRQCDDGNVSNNDACVGVCKSAPSAATGSCARASSSATTATGNNDGCNNSCQNGCAPSGQRAPLNTLGFDTASGCWSGNPCDNPDQVWNADGQSFLAFNEAIRCTGASTCVANVGIGTYHGHPTVCQGQWAVLCDGVQVGTINTLGKICAGSAMSNGCKTSFPARLCATVELRAIADGDGTAGCCGGNQPDTMITAVSAW
jgi:cysteine-rich repeat protein